MSTNDPTYATRAAAICEQLRQGQTLRQVGLKFGLTDCRVQQIAAGQGVKSVRSMLRFQRSGLSKARAATVATMVRQEGLTIHRACIKLGIHPQPLYSHIPESVRALSCANRHAR